MSMHKPLRNQMLLHNANTENCIKRVAIEAGLSYSYTRTLLVDSLGFRSEQCKQKNRFGNRCRNPGSYDGLCYFHAYRSSIGEMEHV